MGLLCYMPRENRRNSVRIHDCPAKIRTEYVPNTSLECYLYTTPLSDSV